MPVVSKLNYGGDGLDEEVVGEVNDTFRFRFSAEDGDYLDITLEDGRVDVRSIGGAIGALMVKPVVGNAIRVSLDQRK